MKAITLTQPWATLVAIGAKKIETRSWATAYRGPLAIHASKNMPAWAKDVTSGTDTIIKALHNAGYTTRTEMKGYRTWNDEKWLPSGVVVATCELIDILQVYPIKYSHPVWKMQASVKGWVQIPPEEPELSFGDYTPGRYAWILDNVKPLEEPIPAKGVLGLWDWEPPSCLS